MKVVIPGGSGQVGTVLARDLRAAGHEVVVLSREAQPGFACRMRRSCGRCGTETELVLKSRRVVPARLLRSGFVFNYPTWDAAARDLCARGAAPQLGRSSFQS